MARTATNTAGSRKKTARSSGRSRGTAAKHARRGAAEDNGLTGFAIHADARKGAGTAFAHLRREVASLRRGAAAGRLRLKTLDPEPAARAYLNQALDSDAVKSFTRPKIKGAESDFKSLGAEALPLTDTTVVKFRQVFNQIPVYGSYVAVELDRDHECIGINSSIGTPKGVSHIARISPAQALGVVAKASGQAARQLTNTPRLYYYFARTGRKWHLAYIIENVRQRKRPALDDGRRDAVLKDYVVDADTGKLLAALPRTATMAALRVRVKDGRGKSRTIVVERRAGGRRELRDSALNVTTYDFGFNDPSRQEALLPGDHVATPPTPWPPAAVSAHANAEEVARFLRTVLKRNNIDNEGGEMVSSINCWDRAEGTRPARQWKNAFWDGDQMVYGQILFPDGTFYSVANMLDIVAHEMFHGVTDHTSRLEYVTQTGALNESYSDIFGVIIANVGKALAHWDWELGTGFDGPGTALRNLQDPTRHDQPKLMKHYKSARPPYTFERNDYGWVHDNSGIHNWAAYSLMTAKVGGRYLFKPAELAALFFIALTMQLSRTSQFSDSRRAVVQAARSLFRKQSNKARDAKLAAIEKGFAAAGIE